MAEKLLGHTSLPRWGMLLVLAGFLFVVAGLVSVAPPQLNVAVRVLFALGGAFLVASVLVDVVRASKRKSDPD